jgi:Regulator of competence-specific genes
MATGKDYIEYVCEQLNGVGAVRSRKMFGEYMVYVNDKPIFLVCDDTVYVKLHEALTELMKNSGRGTPYEGAKEHYILDVDNAELLKKVVEILEPLTPLPKPKKKKL